MRGVVLSYPDVTPANLAALSAAAAARGVAFEQWQPHEITVWCDGATCVPLYRDEAAMPDLILHRTVARLGGVVAPALRLWAGRGTVVLNDPRSAATARDKLATAIALTRAGVPTVPSLGFFPAAALSFSRLGEGRVVVKPAHGLQGRDVAFFADREAAERAQGAAGAQEDPPVVSEHWLAQPSVGIPLEDIRAFVVGGECLALVRRRAQVAGEHRANLALGATATALELHHPAARLAVDATRALGLDYAGVDILGGPDGGPGGGLAVLEVDAWAGFAGVAQATGADIAGAILDLALNRRRGDIT
ncbi:MAG: hypothetical protein NVSMB32_13030 [Actinomycetota bacterium]